MKRAVSFVIERSLLLVVGTMAALIWANVAGASYTAFAQATHFVINDVAMVFFFALAAKEIVEGTRPGGSLSSGREAAVPRFGACGGGGGRGLRCVVAMCGPGRAGPL